MANKPRASRSEAETKRMEDAVRANLLKRKPRDETQKAEEAPEKPGTHEGLTEKGP